MSRICKPRFRMYAKGTPEIQKYVALRKIMVKGVEVQAGEPVEGLRRHMLQYYFRTRRIGPADHPWTNHIVAKRKFVGSVSVEEAAKTSPVPVNDKLSWIIPGSTRRFQTKGDATEWMKDNLNVPVTPVKDDLVWAMPGVEERFKTKSELLEFVEAVKVEAEKAKAESEKAKAEAKKTDEIDPDITAGDTEE